MDQLSESNRAAICDRRASLMMDTALSAAAEMRMRAGQLRLDAEALERSSRELEERARAYMEARYLAPAAPLA